MATAQQSNPVQKNPVQSNPVREALAEQIIPRVQEKGMAEVLVACASWRASRREWPAGMTAERRALRGPRVPVRGRRAYGSTSIVDAEWPADNLHSARTPKLCFVLTGTPAVQVADYVLHCRPGHGILLPAGTPFTKGSHLPDEAPPQSCCEILQLMPYQGGMICWISRRRLDDAGHLQISEETCSVPRSRTPFYLHQLVEEAARSGSHQRLISDSLLQIIVALLHRELQELPVIQTGDPPFATVAVAAAHKEYSIAQAQEYIQHNLRASLSIDQVARFVCTSRTAFTAQFRADTGKTFTQYVQDLRFAEARKLLLGTDLAVRHIGSLVGLRPNRLRTLFQEREGSSPTEFRRRSRT
jgi:AraC-like DNA-binding protein